MENEYGKKRPLKEYKLQGSGGSGILTGKITAKNGGIVNALIVGEETEELVAMSERGQVIRTSVKTIPVLGRATQGVRIMKLEEKDKIASVTTL